MISSSIKSSVLLFVSMKKLIWNVLFLMNHLLNMLHHKASKLRNNKNQQKARNKNKHKLLFKVKPLQNKTITSPKNLMKNIEFN
jgi:hypothetical protein